MQIISSYNFTFSHRNTSFCSTIKSKSKGNRYNIKKKVFKRETLVLLAFFVCVSFPLLSSLPAYVDPTSSLGQKVSTIPDELSVDDHYKVDSCTIDQLNKIRSQLKLPEGETGLKKHKISKSTGCPSTRWLSKYYKEYFQSKEHGGRESFLGINIGCNGGFDAIDMARIGTSNAKFDKVTWRAAIGAEKDSGVCRQADDINIEIENNHVIEGEIHCIEPVPTNYERLINASKKAALGESIVMSKAAIASTNGISKFPNAAYVRSHGTDGWRPEGFGVHSCGEIQGSNTTACEDVPQYSLQTYVNKFVKSTGTINMLYIDVEGYDFDVLFGAGDVLG